MHQNIHKDLILLTLSTILLGHDFLPFGSLSITFHFFVANFEFLLSEPFSKFTVFCVSMIYMNVTEFCEKFRVVSSDFSMMRNIVAPPVAKI